MEARLSLGIVESVWLVGQRAAIGRDEAWSSAAVSGGEGATLGPADCPEDPQKNPQYRSRCLDGKSLLVCDIMAKGANRMLENCH